MYVLRMYHLARGGADGRARVCGGQAQGRVVHGGRLLGRQRRVLRHGLNDPKQRKSGRCGWLRCETVGEKAHSEQEGTLHTAFTAVEVVLYLRGGGGEDGALRVHGLASLQLRGVLGGQPQGCTGNSKTRRGEKRNDQTIKQ